MISALDYLYLYETGYPDLDVTNKQITYRMVLNSTQANGYPLSEVGLFNTDDPATIWNRDTFTSFSKSDTEELRFIIKDTFSANAS